MIRRQTNEGTERRGLVRRVAAAIGLGLALLGGQAAYQEGRDQPGQKAGTAHQVMETTESAAPEARHRKDINRMRARDFQAMGLSRRRAEAVVRYRGRLGRFKSVEDLKRVPKISSDWVDRVRDRLTTG